MDRGIPHLQCKATLIAQRMKACPEFNLTQCFDLGMWEQTTAEPNPDISGIGGSETCSYLTETKLTVSSQVLINFAASAFITLALCIACYLFEYENAQLTTHLDDLKNGHRSYEEPCLLSVTCNSSRVFHYSSVDIANLAVGSKPFTGELQWIWHGFPPHISLNSHVSAITFKGEPV